MKREGHVTVKRNCLTGFWSNGWMIFDGLQLVKREGHITVKHISSKVITGYDFLNIFNYVWFTFDIYSNSNGRLPRLTHDGSKCLRILLRISIQTTEITTDRHPSTHPHTRLQNARAHAHTETLTHTYHTHTRTRARTHAHTHACTHARTHTHTHTRTHARARTHTHTHTNFS